MNDNFYQPWLLYMPSPYYFYTPIPSYYQLNTLQTQQVNSTNHQHINPEKKQKQKISLPNSKKIKRTKQDEEWNQSCENYLNMQKQQQKTQRKLKYNESRNIISNILRNFMNYLKSNHAQDIFFRYKNRNKLDGELKDLLNWFISEKINSSNYIRIKQIIQIFESQPTWKIRIFVTLFMYYSKNYARYHFLNSSKVKSNSRSLILTKLRELDQIILQLASSKKQLRSTKLVELREDFQ